MSISLAWEKDFPNGFGHTSIAFLKRCAGFGDAKNGDLNAAKFVISRCVKQDRIRELRERYPDAVLIPVLSRNKLPLALALKIGLPICYNVYLLNVFPRKLLSAIQRLLHKPKFAGYIKRDTTYILVDDVITQGGTIAALREFVMVRGGKVIAVVALAYAIGSHAIAPKKKYVVRLILKFGTLLILILQAFNIVSNIESLTNAQVKYLLRFSKIVNIERKLAQ